MFSPVDAIPWSAPAGGREDQGSAAHAPAQTVAGAGGTDEVAQLQA